MNWTQPICSACYVIREPNRQPVFAIQSAGMTETCCDCGKGTPEGIYYRIDPRTVKFPAKE